MPSRAAALTRLISAVPAAADVLTSTSVEALRRATADLVQTIGIAGEAEYDRFIKVSERGLKLDGKALRHRLAGRNIVVTGGTGCIGTTLLGQLKRYEPAQITSISRGITKPTEDVEGVRFVFTDVRSNEALAAAMRSLRPDIVFHLAAQHDPGLAENEVKRTLQTNIYGTRHVIDAAKRADAEQLVYASTGKAMRLFSAEIYAASKKASETLLAAAAQSGDLLTSGVRFTHVVDNSIIHHRIHRWIDVEEPVRLHNPEILFYVQSALESAQLLMNACLDVEPNTLTIQAIRDLDWPIGLLDMTVGALMRSRSRAPILLCGYEAGYEDAAYPALFDSRVSGDVSPLLNVFEAVDATESRTCPEIDVFPFTVDVTPKLQATFDTLRDRCEMSDEGEEMRRELQRLSWVMLEARLAKVPVGVLARSVSIMEANPDYNNLPLIHRRTNEAVKAAITSEIARSADQRSKARAMTSR